MDILMIILGLLVLVLYLCGCLASLEWWIDYVYRCKKNRIILWMLTPFMVLCWPIVGLFMVIMVSITKSILSIRDNIKQNAGRK